MTTRSDRAVAAGDEQPGGESGLRWRSHTFGDGVRSLTLTGPLDAGTAGRLWARLAELLERGCRRLIVDASAIEQGGDEPALLAGVFAGRPASCDAVVVAPRGSALVRLLPGWVGVAWTLSEARAQLATGIARHDGGGRPGPAGPLPPAHHHALAARQSLRWALRSAREGDYEKALAWLVSVETFDGPLDEPWQERRRAWLAAWRAQRANDPRDADRPNPP